MTEHSSGEQGLAADVPYLGGGPFVQSLWDAALPLYTSILSHPFMLGIRDGELASDRLAFYVTQDWHFLRAAARAFSSMVDNARNDEWILAFNRSSTDVLLLEHGLQKRMLEILGLTEEQIRQTPPAPTNEAYSSWIQLLALQAPFQESLAALLPCFWLYNRLGSDLKRLGARHPLAADWAGFYAGRAYSQMMEELLELVEDVGQASSDEVRARMTARFLHACRYEFMYWQMNWSLEQWPTPGSSQT